MTIVVFVRHGQSEGNVRGLLSSDNNTSPLTAEGIKQATFAAKEIKKLKPTAFFMSPVLRARQTAEIIAKEIGMAPQIDERLGERYTGILEGTTADKRDNGVVGLWKYRKDAGIESEDQIRSRVKSFVAEQKEGLVLAVTHMSVSETLALEVLGLDDKTGFGVAVFNATISVYKTSNKKTKVLALGSLLLDEPLMKQIPKKFRKA